MYSADRQMTRIVGGVELEPRWQAKPKHPIRESLRWLLGAEPPKYVQGYNLGNLTDDQKDDLQSWAVRNVDKTAIFWGTGIAMLDAAEAIVNEAVDNGNIPAEDSEWRTTGIPADFYTRSSTRKKKRSVKIQPGK